MSKKSLLLASAVLSLGALVASCGGGGGTASATTTPPPSTTTPTTTTPTVGSLGTPAVFTRLSPAGAGQDRYYFVDGSGNKVEVKDLAGKDITAVLYQFNNSNLLVRTATNQVFCVDASNATAKDLSLTFAGHAYANVTNELVRNRPYFLMNATDGGYVVTKDCTAKKVSATQFQQIEVAQDINGQNVFAINNAYAIVRDAATNPNVFVVKSDGTFAQAISNGQNPVVRIDNVTATRPAGSYTTFLVGDNTKSLPIHLVTDNGDLVQVFTSPLNQFGNRTIINKAPNGSYLVVMNSPEVAGAGILAGQQVSCALTAFNVSGNTVTQFQVNGNTFQCGAAGIEIRVGNIGVSSIAAFDVDANNNLFVGARNATATSCGTNISAATGFVAALNNMGVVQGAGYPINVANAVNTPVFSVIGLDNGALAIGGANGTAIAYFQFAPNLTVRSLSNAHTAVVFGAAALPGGAQNCNVGNTETLAASFVVSLNNGVVRVKNTRTNSILIGMISTNSRFGAAATNDNQVASISFVVGGNPTCLIQGEDSDALAGDVFSNNLDRNITNAFVIRRGANNLRHYTHNAAPTPKNAVLEAHFNGANCGGAAFAGQLVQIYSPTDRACVNPVPPVPGPGGFTYNYVNYNTDAVTPVNIVGAGAGINPPTFGDVANNNNALYNYLDSAANRGTVSFCPSGNTWEYLILGANSLQFPGSGSQVGLCFKVFNSFNGAGGVGPNNALGVPFIKF